MTREQEEFIKKLKQSDDRIAAACQAYYMAKQLGYVKRVKFNEVSN